MLAKTGYDENRDECHMVWTPPRCRSARPITLIPNEADLINVLQDPTCSVTAAVAVEESLSSDYSCSGNRSQWSHDHSIENGVARATCQISMDDVSTLGRIRCKATTLKQWCLFLGNGHGGNLAVERACWYEAERRNGALGNGDAPTKKQGLSSTDRFQSTIGLDTKTEQLKHVFNSSLFDAVPIMHYLTLVKPP